MLDTVAELKVELQRLREEVGDTERAAAIRLRQPTVRVARKPSEDAKAKTKTKTSPEWLRRGVPDNGH